MKIKRMEVPTSKIKIDSMKNKSSSSQACLLPIEKIGSENLPAETSGVSAKPKSANLRY